MAKKPLLPFAVTHEWVEGMLFDQYQYKVVVQHRGAKHFGLPLRPGKVVWSCFDKKIAEKLAKTYNTLYLKGFRDGERHAVRSKPKNTKK